MGTLKKMIPNILTILRILVTPALIYLGIKKKFSLVIIFAVFIALTDFLDGKLARKWQVTSDLGAKLDAVADKVLAVGLLIILIIENHLFFYILILEICISVFNIYTFYKTKLAKSVLMGKIKTWVIFSTMILGLASIIFGKLKALVNIFSVLTIIFQLLSLFVYIINYNENLKSKKKAYFENREYYEIVKEILENKEFKKRKKFAHHYNESVYDHVLRVSYDCYNIGKKLNLDYESLAIAGLLHDFYNHPWQEDLTKKPFFKKHAFVHAEEASLNAIKYFPNLVNDKIIDMIRTHMFPLNISLPKYKESWVLTFVDKVDSLDFLMHPYLMSKKYRMKMNKNNK